MAPDQGTEGPSITSDQRQVVFAYGARFGWTALWSVISPYNGERLSDGVVAELASAVDPVNSSVGKVRIVLYVNTNPPTPTLTTDRSAIPTPTPAPQPTVALGTEQERMRACYEEWSEGLRFAYTDDIVVLFPPWWGGADYFARAMVWHVPSGSSAHLQWDNVTFIVSGTPAPSPTPPSLVWRYYGESDSGRTALEDALADEGLQAKIDGWLAAIEPWPWSGPEDVARKAIVVMWAELMPGAREMLLKAEIVGGPENDLDLYCTGERWDFGDGRWSADMGMCPRWDSNVQIERRVEEFFPMLGREPTKRRLSLAR